MRSRNSAVVVVVALAPRARSGHAGCITKNVLILGCGRSGTSIFGELFDALPGFRYFSEPELDEIGQPIGGAVVAVKVPRTAAYLGSPTLAAEWRAAAPDPRVVFWQVRHPLDAVCSLRVGIADGWGHHPRPSDWQEWTHRTIIEQCAHHWATVNSVGFEAVQHEALVTRFEDLIGDPLGFAQDAATMAGVAGDVHTPVVTWADRVHDTNNDRFVEAVASRRRSRPDHSHRVGRWQENLTDDEVHRVLPIVADAAQRFGYALPT